MVESHRTKRLQVRGAANSLVAQGWVDKLDNLTTMLLLSRLDGENGETAVPDSLLSMADKVVSRLHKCLVFQASYHRVAQGPTPNSRLTAQLELLGAVSQFRGFTADVCLSCRKQPTPDGNSSIHRHPIGFVPSKRQ